MGGSEVTVIKGVVTGDADEEQTHAEADVTGGAVQCGSAAQATQVVATVLSSVSALTSTGITAPVLRLNERWPSTLNNDPISPE